MSHYADSFRKDADELAALCGRIGGRLRNAADTAERHKQRRDDAELIAAFLRAEIAHVLDHGKLGKQTKRRLEEAFKETKP